MRELGMVALLMADSSGYNTRIKVVVMSIGPRRTNRGADGTRRRTLQRRLSFGSANSAAWCSDRGSVAGAIMPGLAALFFNEMNGLDAHAALRRLDHVVDRQARD